MKLIFFVFVIFKLFHEDTAINGLNKVDRPFSFPENEEEQTPPPELQNRQLITGTVQPIPLPGTQPPVTSAPSGVITCICVPTGQCNTSLPTDGSGQIDVRIVTNPSGTSPPSTTCQTGLVSCCQLGPYQCGVRYPPVAGSPLPGAGQAPFGAYPWQAVILTTSDVFIGSGALIGRIHILTVAHRVANLTIGSYKIRLGEWDASSTNEPIAAQEFSVASSVIHPNYNANNLQNDIAIVRLSTAVNLGQTPTIATVCLPATSFVGQTCFVSGWGRNDFGPTGTYQSIQKQVDVLVRSASDCQSALSATRLGPNFVFNSASFICAGGVMGRDACTGDGGSPLVCQLGGRWFVTGLVAWGIGCATGGVPGVYVNVASYIPWIQSILNT